MAAGARNATVVRGMYTPMAAAYAEIWAPLLRPFGAKLLDRMRLDGATRVLELGCGVGLLLPEIESRAPGAVVVGADLVEGMIARAPSRFRRVVMDGSRLGFPAGTFDAVVLPFMLFHLPDPRSMLEGVREAMRAGGQVGAATWGTEGSFPAADVFADELDAAGAAPDPGSGGAEELVNTTTKMERILAEAGYVDASAAVTPWTRRWDLEGFMEWKTRLGTSARRLGSLEERARDECICRIRERLNAGSPEDLVDRDEVVLATARAPD